jgi:hypothetical protein
MNQIVDAYVGHIRKRFGMGKTEFVAHGSTDARQRCAAHHGLVSASPFAFILSSALSARPSKDERGRAHARGPPVHLTKNQPHPTSQVLPARPRPHTQTKRPPLRTAFPQKSGS